MHNCIIKSNYQSKSCVWWVSCSFSFIAWQTLASYYLGQDSAECTSSDFKICFDATITNWIILLYHAVKLSQLRVWKLKYGRIWQKLRCLVQVPNRMLVRWWRFWWEKRDKTPSTDTGFTKWAYDIEFLI